MRDDRWHHVAVVMYGGRRPDISTHVLLYVDGQLETTTNKAVREVRTDTSGQSARQVQLGRNIRDISPLEANDGVLPRMPGRGVHLQRSADPDPDSKPPAA